MSYYKKIEYKIQPKDSYKIWRNCAGCGLKTMYINTNHFRVNANGNLINVWLIYQCETCKHTYNLSIFERVKSTAIDQIQYEKFLANDEELSYEYGNQKSVFVRNKAFIDSTELEYDIIKIGEKEVKAREQFSLQLSNEMVVIQNPYEIKLRVDKILSKLFKVSRSQVKQFIKEGMINCASLYTGKTTIVESHHLGGYAIALDDDWKKV